MRAELSSEICVKPALLSENLVKKMTNINKGQDVTDQDKSQEDQDGYKSKQDEQTNMDIGSEGMEDKSNPKDLEEENS